MVTAEKKLKDITANATVEGTSSILTLTSRRIAMELADRNIELLAKLNKIWEENGLSYLEERKSGGGSDAAEVTNFGIPCLDSLGVYGKNIIR